MKSLIYVILTALTLYITTSCAEVRKCRNNDLFKTMWQIDTCGRLEYRYSIAMYLIQQQEKKAIFKTKKDVICLLGKPYSIERRDNKERFYYFIKATEDCVYFDLLHPLEEGIVLSSLTFTIIDGKVDYLGFETY